MRTLYIFLVSITIFSLSSFAKDYTSAEVDAILKENAQLAQQAISTLKENMNIKSILKEAGLLVDKKAEKVKIVDGDAFMSACNVVIFTEEEFEALNKKKLEEENQQKKSPEADFREAVKGDFKDKSKTFWDNVIY